MGWGESISQGHPNTTFPLSYKIPACHPGNMPDEPKWKTRAVAVEYWLAAAVVAGSFVAGLISAVPYIAGG
ncbi:MULTISPECIES: hypothetical protein [unclassified Sphingopyxis]|uniref:hypothetical protein n=1 Tax=unclassified Sphingopyxis TaxID=2614943 RepID=UPI0024AD5E81|nr:MULTISPECIES: hypothetical protein [unclassified Sphingopyxis]